MFSSRDSKKEKGEGLGRIPLQHTLEYDVTMVLDLSSIITVSTLQQRTMDITSLCKQ